MRRNVVRLLNLSCAVLFVFFLVNAYCLAQSMQATQPEQATSQQAAQSQSQDPSGSEPGQGSSPAAKPPAAQDQEKPFRRTIIVPPRQQLKAPQTPNDLLLFRDAQQLSPEAQEKLQKAMQRALQEAVEKDSRQPYRLLGENQPGGFDRGIYVRQVDGANVCGSIVSYNFSAGTNPQLESVTTCTPSNAVASKRARVPNNKPEGPRVLQTAERQEEKK
jgi:hypothetical protein